MSNFVFGTAAVGKVVRAGRDSGWSGVNRNTLFGPRYLDHSFCLMRVSPGSLRTEVLWYASFPRRRTSPI